MNSAEAVETYKEFAQQLANGDVIPEVIQGQLRDSLERRASFMKNSKVQQAILLLKQLKKYEDHLRAGARKAEGCTRFAPRKHKSTIRKEVVAMRKIEQTLSAWGFPHFEVEGLLDKVRLKVGGKHR